MNTIIIQRADAAPFDTTKIEPPHDDPGYEFSVDDGDSWTGAFATYAEAHKAAVKQLTNHASRKHPTKDATKTKTTTDETGSAVRKAQELRRLIGDPRVRVEVPTTGPLDEQSALRIAKRYHIG